MHLLRGERDGCSGEKRMNRGGAEKRGFEISEGGRMNRRGTEDAEKRGFEIPEGKGGVFRE